MIRYALHCSDGHEFESWFRSAAAFDALCVAAKLSCPVCGITAVEKAVMAPQVRPAHAVSAPAPLERERMLAQLKAKIEAESDYVGGAFVQEARAIHAGDAPERSIHGEAHPNEARALIEDGIPVAPLPFLPTRKTN